jgi:hypothetical protein
MPPVTSAEKREAAVYLSNSGKKQRISEPAILTEVARRRIRRGHYGEVTPDQSRVTEASDDLGLSRGQQKDLRKRLNDPMPVCTLDTVFARVDASQQKRAAAVATLKSQRIEELTQQFATGLTVDVEECPWAEPARHARARYAAERLGVAQQQLLVSDDWMQDNMPALTIEASRRGVSLKEFVGVDSPVDLCVHDEHDDEKLTRCLGFDVPDVRSDLLGIDIKYSRPPSPMESLQVQEERQARHRRREEEAFIELEQTWQHEEWQHSSRHERVEHERLEAERRLEQERLERERRERVLQERAARNPAARELQVNTAALAALGLPPLVVPARSASEPAPALPEVLRAALAAGLVLEARVVDYWTGSQPTRTAFQSWLQDLGFEVTVTSNRRQKGPACGYVAARALNLMYAAGDAWRTVEVSDAADEYWIDFGNAILENDAVGAIFLEAQHVYQLAQAFREHDFPDEQQPCDIATHAWPCVRWLAVHARDSCARAIAEWLMHNIADVSNEPLRARFVTNTETSFQDGLHWISVAVSMRYI